ncbi:MAG: trehalose-phosphatase [Candidatus Omnitrophica bacterium]|nr:trehalose-phosphatase [Candidatus Omnitrophota bacterium]
MDRPDSFGNPPGRVKYLTRKKLAQQLKEKKRIFVFLDYDGTLSPIVKNPKLARISPETKNILYQLSRNKTFIIGIVSGRSLRDIKKRVGLKTVVYAGNHGLELEYRGRKVSPKLSTRFQPIFKKAKTKIKKALKSIKGVIQEDKRLVLAVHYRKVAKSDQKQVVAIFNRSVKPFLSQKLFKTARGKKVLELKPNLKINKAAAIDFFQKKFKKGKNDLTVFIGDDITDEDVFKRLKPPDLAIRVGRKKNSQARHFLKNTREVTLRLKDILYFITSS